MAQQRTSWGQCSLFMIRMVMALLMPQRWISMDFTHFPIELFYLFPSVLSGIFTIFTRCWARTPMDRLRRCSPWWTRTLMGILLNRSLSGLIWNMLILWGCLEVLILHLDYFITILSNRYKTESDWFLKLRYVLKVALLIQARTLLYIIMKLKRTDYLL